MQPANTGREINNKIDTANILHENNDINKTDWNRDIDDAFNNVTIKLILPNKELNPTK